MYLPWKLDQSLILFNLVWIGSKLNWLLEPFKCFTSVIGPNNFSKDAHQNLIQNVWCLAAQKQLYQQVQQGSIKFNSNWVAGKRVGLLGWLRCLIFCVAPTTFSKDGHQDFVESISAQMAQNGLSQKSEQDSKKSNLAGIAQKRDGYERPSNPPLTLFLVFTFGYNAHPNSTWNLLVQMGQNTLGKKIQQGGKKFNLMWMTLHTIGCWSLPNALLWCLVWTPFQNMSIKICFKKYGPR